MKLDCDIVQELYPLYIDNELSPQLKKRISEHLASCNTCQLTFKEEKGFQDFMQTDNEIIQPDRTLDEKLKQSLKQQRYTRNIIIGLVLLLSIITVYFLFFRFTFLIGSTDLTTPSFAKDYEEIQAKLDISENAKVTNLSLRFNSAGQMEDFRTRIVDFSNDQVDIYDMTFSPRIDGFHMYRVKHDHVSHTDFISKSQAPLPAEKVFTYLDKVGYGSIMTDVGANRYWIGSDARMKDIEIRDDVLPRIHFYYIEHDQIKELEVGNMYNNVYSLSLHTDSSNEGPVRIYLFQ